MQNIVGFGIDYAEGVFKFTYNTVFPISKLNSFCSVIYGLNYKSSPKSYFSSSVPAAI